MYLIEASRGCGMGLSLLRGGFMYRPADIAALHAQHSVIEGLAKCLTIGLVGAEMASQPGIAAIVIYWSGWDEPRRHRYKVRITRDPADALGAQKEPLGDCCSGRLVQNHAPRYQQESD
jgi:hypothetical protein